MNLRFRIKWFDLEDDDGSGESGSEPEKKVEEKTEEKTEEKVEPKFKIPLEDGSFVELTQEQYESVAVVGANKLAKDYKEKQKKTKPEETTLEERLRKLEEREQLNQRKNDDAKIITAMKNTVKSDPDLEDWADEVVASVIGQVAISRQQTGKADLKEIFSDQMAKYKVKVGTKGTKVDPKKKLSDKEKTALTTSGSPTGEITESKKLSRKSFRDGTLAKKVLASYGEHFNKGDT